MHLRLPGAPARRLLALLLTALATMAVLAAIGTAAPAQAAAPPYVALGDSYSSGTGTRAYLDDGSGCQRSAYAFPSLVAAQKGYALNFRACSGARIGDVRSTQLSALSSATRYVTISVGGNDAGFADVLTECAMPGWMSNCNAAIDGAQSYISGTLPAALSSLYAEIRTRAPYARVVVVGYPRVFMGEDCNALTWFSPAEQTRLNQTADQLNSRLAAAASARGFGFANPTAAFTGHAVCDSPEWINGLSNPVSESYHPNRAGHASGYAPLVGQQLNGAPTGVSAATVRAALAAADRQAALQGRYAERDAKIEQQPFRAPQVAGAR